MSDDDILRRIERMKAEETAKVRSAEAAKIAAEEFRKQEAVRVEVQKRKEWENSDLYKLVCKNTDVAYELKDLISSYMVGKYLPFDEPEIIEYFKNEPNFCEKSKGDFKYDTPKALQIKSDSYKIIASYQPSNDLYEIDTYKEEYYKRVEKGIANGYPYKERVSGIDRNLIVSNRTNNKEAALEAIKDQIALIAVEKGYINTSHAKMIKEENEKLSNIAKNAFAVVFWGSILGGLFAHCAERATAKGNENESKFISHMTNQASDQHNLDR